jgi:hypothetical protein
LVVQASQFASHGDYASAIATGTAAFQYAPGPAITVITKAKISSRATDVLAWAKLNYQYSDFSQTQAAVSLVAAGFRAVDLNLVRANQFIAFQQTGTGTDPLASVPMPTLPPVVTVMTGPNDIFGAVSTAILSGDKMGALRAAAGAFAAAADRDLNAAAAVVAKALRNMDENLVRANAYVQAQTAGQAYTITELQ